MNQVDLFNRVVDCKPAWFKEAVWSQGKGGKTNKMGSVVHDSKIVIGCLVLLFLILFINQYTRLCVIVEF